jgi:hypothetical protein
MENLHEIIAALLHPEYCTIWCTVSLYGTVRPAVLEDFMNVDYYLKSSKKNLSHSSMIWVSVLRNSFFKGIVLDCIQ